MRELREQDLELIEIALMAADLASGDQLGLKGGELLHLRIVLPASYRNLQTLLFLVPLVLLLFFGKVLPEGEYHALRIFEVFIEGGWEYGRAWHRPRTSCGGTQALSALED